MHQQITTAVPQEAEGGKSYSELATFNTKAEWLDIGADYEQEEQ